MNSPFVALAQPENTTKRAWDMGMNSGGLRKLSSIEVPDRFIERMAFGIDVFNKLFNGDGLIAGQRITVAAPRGSGKTTFLLAGLQSLVTTNIGLKAAYISNEECVEQLAYTATRINCLDVPADNMTDIDQIAELMKSLDVIVLDSVAGLTCSHIRSPQLREEYALNTLCQAAQQNECTTIFIQHFTKDGKEKGNSGWGHAVDTCMSIYKMDAEEYGENVRLFEVDKNRFGSGAEIMLRMTKNGFDYDNPVSEKTSSDSTPGATGVYIKAKRADTLAILNVVRDHNTDGGAKLQDFGKLDIDMGRVERLLKELVSRGKLCQTGGGKGQTKESKRWLLGDTEDDDFGDEA